jgi:pilus assembly protein CpaB
MRRKWSPASKLFGALAVIFAIAAFAIVRGYAARVQALTPALGTPVPVLVATRDLPRGTQLSADMLRPASLPSRFAPPGPVSRVSGAVGRTLLAGLGAGEVLTRTRLGAAGVGPVAALVPEGLRAFSVVTSMPAGSVRAGDHVDLLATFAGGRPHTETTASAIEVLMVLPPGGTAGSFAGAGATSGPDTGGPDISGLGGEAQTLVLLVRPDQAEQLAYARAFADISISLEGASAEGD